MANIAKWHSKNIYFNEVGEEITAGDAKRNYIIINKKKYVKIDGATGYIEWWCRCEQSKQRTIW